MSEPQALFRDVMQTFGKAVPRKVFGDIRRLVTLAWAVVGVCLTKGVSLSQWGEVVESRAHYAASHERRFARWMQNPHVTVATFYAAIVPVALQHWDPTCRWYVSLDSSVLPNGFVLIRTALVYRGRAIPLAWRVIPHASAAVAYGDYEPVLRQTLQVVPPGVGVVLLADRAFGHAQCLDFIRQQGWHCRIRVKSDTLVCLATGATITVEQLRPPCGEAHFYHHVAILAEAIPDVSLALADAPDLDEPWYVLSDEPTDEATLTEFALRFDIEENFLDDKSNGFDVEASRLSDAAALERLFLVLACATLFCTSVGVGVVKANLRRWVDTHWGRGLSYLKIGWAWLRQQSRRHWPRFPLLALDSAPDPVPAHASRRALARSPRRWRVATFHHP